MIDRRNFLVGSVALIASFVDAPAADHSGRNAAHVAEARLVTSAFS